MMPFVQNENEQSHQNGEKADKAAVHMDQAASGLLGQKWYKCTYCKGGLSRAQALGGHMNIHRRQRTLQSRSSSVACDRGSRSSSPLPSLSSGRLLFISLQFVGRTQ
ncbi:hypothetical protein SUGI_0863080 [Cryptomeria japonica]|nr:hypothetical protein SUGI_0863080 [Cryptomeria japonica]